MKMRAFSILSRMCILCVYRHIDAVYQAYFKSATAAAADTSRNALLSSFKG